jgi:hypothetical protein
MNHLNESSAVRLLIRRLTYIKSDPVCFQAGSVIDKGMGLKQ